MATQPAQWARRTSPDDEEHQQARVEALDEVLAFASHVAKAYVGHVDGGRESALLLTPALMLRRLIEGLAALRELVAARLPGPAPAHLRTMLEVELGLTHLLGDDFLRRSASYVVWREKQTVAQLRTFKRELEQLDEEDAEGRAMLADLIGSDIERLDEAEAAGLRRLSHPALTESVEEYDEKRPRHWYSFFGGPTNARDLAALYGELSLYLATYKVWSRHVHGTELFEGNVLIQNGAADLYPLHSERELSQYTVYAITFTLRAMRRVTRERMDSEHVQHLARWYVEEFKAIFDRVRHR